MTNLRSNLIRLAHARPELRTHLLPLLKEAAPRSDALLQSKVTSFLTKNLRMTTKLGGPVGAWVSGQRMGFRFPHDYPEGTAERPQAHEFVGMYSPKTRTWKVLQSSGVGKTTAKNIDDDTALGLVQRIFDEAKRS